MVTRIAFFDVTPKERLSFERYFSGKQFELMLFSEPIQKVPLYDYKEASIISVFTTSKVDKEIISHLPKLKFVCCRSTGVDNVEVKYAHKKGVAISNVPGYGQTTVAEYAFMLMLALVRKLPASLNAVKDGQINHQRLTGFTLHGRVLGVVGSGKIGMAVIKLAKAFGMHVIAFDPFPNKAAEKELGFSYLPLPQLLRSADIVSLHAPLTKDNFHLINAKALSLMKEEALLINTARGELVDTPALIDALKNNQLAGAALDVVEGETMYDVDIEMELLRNNPKQAQNLIAELDVLSKLGNVILTPHNAFNSREALSFIRKTTALNIQGFLAGKPQNIVK